jgi:hypothetical protein
MITVGSTGVWLQSNGTTIQRFIAEIRIDEQCCRQTFAVQFTVEHLFANVRCRTVSATDGRFIRHRVSAHYNNILGCRPGITDRERVYRCTMLARAGLPTLGIL